VAHRGFVVDGDMAVGVVVVDDMAHRCRRGQ